MMEFKLAGKEVVWEVSHKKGEVGGLGGGGHNKEIGLGKK